MRSTLTRTLSAFRSDEGGATAIEYGLIASILILGIIAATTNLGTAVKDMFGRVAQEYQQVSQ